MRKDNDVRRTSVLAGRYTVERELKDAQGIRTLLASDAGGRQVVIKTADVARLPSAGRLRLEHEASILRRLDNPSIAPLIDFGHAEDSVYLVMAFVDGMTLSDRIAHQTLDVADVLTVGRRLAEALAEAHGEGILHRDVKPSNIMVDDGDPLRHATLIDFGLARTRWLDPTVRDLPAGTVRYMSPEQAGLIEQDVDERSDLYALGAVLFECVAGRPLFDGTTFGEVLRQHLTAATPDLRGVRSEVPRALADVVQHLVATDPRDRYQSASGLLADLNAIAEGLERGEEEPPVVVGLYDRRPAIAEPAFVGRTDELAAIVDRLSDARAGRGGVLHLEAESGGGKTRLLDELTQRVATDDVWILRGQAVDQAAQRPLEILRGLADGIVARASTDPDVATAIAGRVGDRKDAICAALPELEHVLGAPATTVGPEAFGETRTVAALSALLTSVGSSDRPAIVLLDDCQWADEATLKLLTQWQPAPGNELGSRHVLLVVAFRSEEVGPDHPLRRSQPMATVELPPLGAQEIGRLIESMAGPVPDEVVETVVRLSEGSPFMASAVLRGLVEYGALVDTPDGWIADRALLDDARASRRAAAFLARRLGLMPQSALRLLSIGAVLGKEFDPALAARLAGQSSSDAVAVLEEARRRHIIWFRHDACAFVHDKLRETVLEMLGTEQRAGLHRSAARYLQEHDPGRIFDLAYHFDAAGEPEHALSYAIAAAEQARARHALDISQQQYEIAERGARTAEPDVRLRIAEGLGDVLMLRGRYDEAGASLEAGRSLAADPVVQARIEGKLGELAFKRGDVRAAKEILEAALRTLGRWVPRRTIGFIASAIVEILSQALHSILPRLFCGRRRLEGAEAEFVAIRIYSRLAHVYWFGSGSVPTLWTHLREMNLAERYPPTLELAQAYSEHAPVMTLIPWFSRGAAYAERSLAIRTDHGDVWGQGQSLHFLGVVLYASSSFEECIERCREAVRHLERTGDRWEVNTASWHIAYSLYRLGDLEGATEAARRVYLAGAEIGDAQARGISLAAWSKASGGHVPDDLITAELARPQHDVHTSAEVLQAQAIRLISQGRTAEASKVLTQAHRMVRKAGLRQEYVAPVLPWLATAQRMHVEKLVLSARNRHAAIRSARRTASRALRVARFYRNNLPHALREAGIIASMQGRTQTATRAFERSMAVAKQLGMRYELAATAHARARVNAERGVPGAVDEVKAAEELLGAFVPQTAGAEPITPSLLERFDTVLESGRRIASALTSDAVYESIHDAALTLLRGERCAVFAVSADGDLTPVFGHAADASRTLTERALDEGAAVALDTDTDVDPAESVVLSGIRSALAAPVLVRGRIAACFYVDHRRVAALFGEDEERLAGFIATIAGAALENAEGFAEIRELTRTLERRVDERTAELAQANEELQASVDREREVAEQLRRVDRLKTELMAMAAHDLRTPLTVIGGFASTLAERWDELAPSDERALIDRITANTKRLTEFVENLLQFARIESGELGYEVRPFDLGALVRRTVNERTVGGSQDRFQVRIPDALPSAAGDEQRIWQVVTNLLSNATKFTPDGLPIDVTVVHDGDSLAVEVRDRGPGIPPEEQDKLFRKFSQVDHRSPKLALGTGLGLYICKKIIDAHGGVIDVRSTPGDGATFMFRIPVATPSARSEPPLSITTSVHEDRDSQPRRGEDACT